MIKNPSAQEILYFHGYKLELFINLFHRKKFPNKLLLSGEKGIGKSTLAYHFINYVLSLNEECKYEIEKFKINKENKSYKLIQNKTNPNFNLIDVNNDKKDIEINQIRQLILNLNKSSFNTRPRFVLIDNIELLNINATNALLKNLEEPQDNTYFILIHNNKKVLSTLKSRCLNFKITLSYKNAIETTNKILNNDIKNLLNEELISFYSTPGNLLKILDLKHENNIDFKNTNLKDLLKLFIKEKYYFKRIDIRNIVFSLIELYFRKNISINDSAMFDLYNYFLKKMSNLKRFNLDEDTFFMELNEKILNG